MSKIDKRSQHGRAEIEHYRSSQHGQEARPW